MRKSVIELFKRKRNGTNLDWVNVESLAINDPWIFREINKGTESSSETFAGFAFWG